MTPMVRIVFLLAGTLAAQPLRSLKAVPVPATPGIENYVRDTAALAQLGKAFFWDMQAGSDGHTACASCHFHAGADHRRANQLSGAAARNATLTAGLFPFRKLADPSNRNSPVLDDAAIAAVLRRHNTLEGAGPALIAAANEAGGKDNIAVVLVAAKGGAPAPRSWWPFRR